MDVRSDAQNDRSTILIVDRHEPDRASLRMLLHAAGFQVLASATAEEGYSRLADARIDAVIVDPDLTDGDGLRFVEQVAGSGNVVFVVATNEDEQLPDRAYACGAADFSYKPVAASELIARLRRGVGTGRSSPPTGSAPPRMSLNRQERTCLLDGRTYHLTRHERDLLACLLDSPGHFTTYEDLIVAIWGESSIAERQYLRVLTAQVRRKLGDRDGNAPLIRTVIGEGLKLNV